jgi:hypothetical protein
MENPVPRHPSALQKGHALTFPKVGWFWQAPFPVYRAKYNTKLGRFQFAGMYW